MSEENTALKNLVTDATAALRETEVRLEQVAQAAFNEYKKFRNGREAVDDSAAIRLQQIGQQLVKLSERSSALQTYLRQHLDAPPVNDDHWPRVKILQSQEEERTQIARELEDSVGQLLANTVFELASVRLLLENDNPAVSEGLDALQTELEEGLADIRHMITDLEPATVLKNFGLGGGVRRYLEQFESRTNIKTQLRINTNIGRLPSVIEVAIFRIIQEALQNVQRHAAAGQVIIVIEEQEGAIVFSVLDDGQGMTSDRVGMTKKNFGLARMVDYADLLNSQLRIFSEPGQGTHVCLTVPYRSLQ